MHNWEHFLLPSLTADHISVDHLETHDMRYYILVESEAQTHGQPSDWLAGSDVCVHLTQSDVPKSSRPTHFYVQSREEKPG